MESNLYREICETADGSHTLYIPSLDEHYHSVAGAITESRHVYIDCGLDFRGAADDKPLKVLEFGFGTGLDAILVHEWTARHSRDVFYTGLELYPLSPLEVATLGYTDNSPGEAIHNALWETEVMIDRMKLRKIKTDFIGYVERTVASDERFDVIFYDAFAPAKQPELWTPSFLASVIRLLNPGGILTTYCAKGYVRRAFAAAGAIVERLQGPPGGKREILRISVSPDRHPCIKERNDLIHRDF